MKTSWEFESLLIRLMRDGVRVRVIVDHDNMGITGSKVGRMYEAGVRIVSMKQTGHMNHMYAVEDGTVVLTGSFNWTSHPVCCQNPKSTSIQPNITLVGFNTKMTLVHHHHPPPLPPPPQI